MDRWRRPLSTKYDSREVIEVMAGYGCEEYAGYGYMELRPCIMVKYCADGAEYVAREPVVLNTVS
jgi:hypothetical protein